MQPNGDGGMSTPYPRARAILASLVLHTPLQTHKSTNSEDQASTPCAVQGKLCPSPLLLTDPGLLRSLKPCPCIYPILSDGPEAHFKSIDIPLRVKRWHPQLTVPYKQLANLAEERALNPLCMVPGAPDQVVAKVGRSSTRKLSFSQVAMETKRMLQTERKKNCLQTVEDL